MVPKNSLGLDAREAVLGLGLGFGLEAVLVCPVGMKVLAAGFGTNSMALTLNLPEVAEVGVRIVLDVCELETRAAFVLDLLGGFCEV